MAIELYDLSVPPLVRGFAAMAAFLDKGRDWADTRGLLHDTLLEARLFEDMAPLTAQVQRASDAAKFAGARLAGIEPPAMPDTEASFDELQARIQATVEFLNSIPRESIDGREDAEIEVKTPSRSYQFRGLPYVTAFVLPNFYFHVTTTYAILRHRGVPLVKLDYLGGL